jgi:class 3 adenylate cyclase
MAEERRLVTVLFADVVGSTALGEALDPEDVRALLGRLFAIATDAVERHGGRVEKFIGDAIMAVFGVPIAHDDDAARALSAALELRDRVRADATLGERMPIRLGVNGGEVIASLQPDAGVLVTGDPVNTAARLQSAAEPWSILVGERTVRATSERFQFGPQVEVEAKGKTVPVPARELIGLGAGRPQRRAARIVGREADLDQLELVARRTFEERRPFLVSVVAPAGVGKSRLLEEFLARLDPDVPVAVAQCLPYGQRLTYWPMRAILLSIVGCGDDSTPDDLRASLTKWLRDANEPDAERTAELLAATVGAGEIEGDRVALFTAWRRLVELAAERRPQVVVIEDLHWSSDSLLDLVEAMLQPRADVPLVMIALARPELLDRRPGWGGGRRNAISISLEPLPSQAVAALVADLLDRPSPQIVDAVVGRAEGNPFYAGEIVRSLTDRLGPEPDAEQIRGAIAALPDTVQATVLARLDALNPTVRRVVQLGAVLGRSFEPRAIPVVDSSISSAAVDEAIEDLLDRDLVRPGARGAVSFRHILIREVAYNTLPRAERARIHGAAGRWLDAEATRTGRSDELAELVAFHLREAVSLSTLLAEPPDAELQALAVTWLRRAAERAASGAAAVEAARHLNAAIELAPPEEQPNMYERLGQIWSGGEQGVDALDRAYELARQLQQGTDQELRLLAEAMAFRARWIGSIGRAIPPAEMDARYAEIERLLDAPDVSPIARAHAYLAMAFRPMVHLDIPSEAEYAASAAWSAKALGATRELGLVDLISAALDAASIAPFGDDRVAEVQENARLRLELGDRISTEERVDARIVQAWTEFILGNLDAAEEAGEQARAGLMPGQASAWVLGATAWRMSALHGMGRWDDVVLDLARAERAWAESELAAPGFSLNGFFAAFSVARSRGDVVLADRVAEEVRRILRRSDPLIRNQRMIAFIDADLAGLDEVIRTARVFTPRLDHVYYALTLLADRRHSTPLEPLDELLDYALERGLNLISSQALRLRGLIGQDAADLERALELFKDMGAAPYVARATAELGILRGDGAAIERGLAGLEALGDVEHAARIASERKAASTPA